MRREIKPQAFLARLPLFQGLSDGELARLAAATTRRRLRRGEVLFRQGEPSTGIYAVVYGSIQLVMASPGVGEHVADIIGAGRSFAETVMFLEKPYIVSAVALGDTLVLHVSRQAIYAELERSPAFARRIIASLSSKLEATVRELETYALGSAARRLAAWLARSAQVAGDGPAVVALPASKRAIASKLNLSAEHLSRILRELAGEGLIEVSGRKVRIADLERLRAHVEPGRKT